MKRARRNGRSRQSEYIVDVRGLSNYETKNVPRFSSS